MSTRRFVIRTGEDFGRTIAEARLDMGLTQSDLAGRTGIDRTYLARIEAGHTTTHVERILELLRELGVSLTAAHEVPREHNEGAGPGKTGD